MTAKYEMPGHQGLVETDGEFAVQKSPTYYLPETDYIAEEMAKMTQTFPDDSELRQVAETMQQLPPDVLVPCMFGIAQAPDGTLAAFFYPSQLNGDGIVTD